jgi:hypothetical protein
MRRAGPPVVIGFRNGGTHAGNASQRGPARSPVTWLARSRVGRSLGSILVTRYQPLPSSSPRRLRNEPGGRAVHPAGRRADVPALAQVARPAMVDRRLRRHAGRHGHRDPRLDARRAPTHGTRGHRRTSQRTTTRTPRVRPGMGRRLRLRARHGDLRPRVQRSSSARADELAGPAGPLRCRRPRRTSEEGRAPTPQRVGQRGAVRHPVAIQRGFDQQQRI